MASRLLLFRTSATSLEDDGYWQAVYEYMAVYGIHVLLGILLSAVTVYRREMSCNRVFHQEGQEQEEEKGKAEATVDGKTTKTPLTKNNNKSPSSCRIRVSDAIMDQATEELLESAGSFCSCQPIVQLASSLLCKLMEQQQEDIFPSDAPNPKDSFEEPAIHWRQGQPPVTPSDLLERAGHFCSGEPILAAMALFLYENKATTLAPSSRQSTFDPFTHFLPPDVHVHIASFLHPRDVLSLSSVSRSYHSIVEDPKSPESAAIWNTLFERDYAWVLYAWNMGKEAVQRSMAQSAMPASTNANTNTNTNTITKPNKVTLPRMSKEFYFRFGETYLDYLLAGRNSQEDCGVGLQGHIYDITSFVDSHPGSPDTLMVHAGRDASRLFEDMGHSLIARRLATKFCVLVDLGFGKDSNGWGLRPTEHTTKLDENHATANCKARIPPRVKVTDMSSILLGRRSPRNIKRRGGTLLRIRQELDKELALVKQRLEKKFNTDNILGTVNPYYDPLLQEWRVWYTNASLQVEFASAG